MFLGTLATGGLALGGNFLGITGALLGDFPDAAAPLRLDIIYPVNGLKRCYNPEKGYEFVYPEAYLGDATMAARNANRQASATSLDPGAPSAKPPQIFGQAVQEPQSAFGPMGGTGEENVSVIVSRSPPGGFRLDRFGDARNQAEWLLANVLARPGTGKTAVLYDAYARAPPARAPRTTRSSTPSARTPGTGTTSRCSRSSGQAVHAGRASAGDAEREPGARRISKNRRPSRSACSCPRGDAWSAFYFEARGR